MKNYSEEIVNCWKKTPELFAQAIQNQVDEINSFEFEPLGAKYSFNSGFMVMIDEFNISFENNLPERCLYILEKIKENFNVK